MTILDIIIESKKAEIKGLEKKYSGILPLKSQKNFLESIKKKEGGNPSLIAEIKRASPSKGDIFPNADILQIAKIYAESGASAISFLTDKPFFGGKIEELEFVGAQNLVPLLRKDFILEKSQILEARIYGADAVLLMVSVLKEVSVIRDLIQYAESFGMDCLVETHDAEEIQVAIEAGAQIIGVNSRDFTDLSIDLRLFETLLPQIPEGILRVAESGLETIEAVEAVAPLCDAILVGTNFMKTQDYAEMERLVKQFATV